MYEQLELLLDGRADDPAGTPAAPAEAVEADDAPERSEPFGLWLLAQQDRRGLIGTLARAARADAGFPKRGGPDDVRSRLTLAGAEGDMFEAIDDAEAAWMADR